jgi:septal ring factor EnvC (AmiA/AmiB activator)
MILLALLLCGSSIDDETKKLAELRAELEQKREAVRDLDNQQRSLVSSLGELDESLSKLTDERDKAKKRLDDLQSELGELESKAAVEEHALGDARARLEARLRALYVGGEGGTARALLGAEGFEELALRRRFLQSLTENDGKLVDDVASTTERVRATKQRLKEATDEAAFTEKQIEDQRTLIETTRGDRQAAIARIGSEKDLAAREAKELEDQQQKLALLVTNLVDDANRRALHVGLQKRGILAKGKLPRPVEGVVIRKFGVIVDPDTKAENVSNGIEIRADAGTPVAAVADGKVVHVGWMRGFGRVVILDHGDGHHTISAHLSKPTVNRGDEVKRGQTIGLVGDTESLNGPKLYFELRENGHPRDPQPVLK